MISCLKTKVRQMSPQVMIVVTKAPMIYLFTGVYVPFAELSYEPEKDLLKHSLYIPITMNRARIQAYVLYNPLV